MDAGIELIKKWEGLSLKAYKCPAGVWTIGYGMTRLGGKPVKSTDKMGYKKDADLLLRAEIKDHFLPELQKIPIWQKLNRNQQGALLSFAWNLGASFYGSKGFETITKALQGNLNAVPDALMLYVMGGGKKLQGLVNRRKDEADLWNKPVAKVEPIGEPNPIDLIQYPKSVLVNQKFDVIGKFYGDTDAKLLVLADGKYPLPECQTKDGVIDYECVFNTEGDRQLSFHYQNHSQSIDIKVTAVKESITVDRSLTGSVGNGGKNSPGDVIKVQYALKDLGYPIGEVDGKVGNKTIHAIRLFQSIINGQTQVSGDGRVDVNGKTHQWLNAKNAPKWQLMPNTNKAISFWNRELDVETWDKHDYGTDWMAGALLWIAKDYHNTYRSKNPNAALFTINDVSLPVGGNTPDHSGHETGLCCDIYLPKIDGGSGGIDYLSPVYDWKASQAILESINRCPTVDKAQIYFNDPVMVKKGLCKSVRGHHHHYHIGVKVPPIQR